MNLGELWVEKYRPQTLEDLIVSDETKDIIKGFGKNIPNLLFLGSQGTGKTTLARIIVKDILKCDYLYINASDESGVDTIREKVIGFSQIKSFDGELKVVILDEADYLTGNSMAILRNVMESYAHTTRFILTGNYKHKIIPALQSRCQSLDIKPDLKASIKRCYQILKSENIEFDDNQKINLINLVKSYFPDLRKAINELQKYSSSGKLNITTKNNSNEVCELIYDNIKSKKTLETRKYLIDNDHLFDNDHERLLTDLLNFYYTLDIPDTNKKSAILTIADHLYRIVHVSDREICFIACLLQLEDT